MVGIPLNKVQDWKLKAAHKLNDWLPEGITLLGGRPKAGKSWLAERASFEISKHCNVLHFSLEYNRVMLQERMRGYDSIRTNRLRLYCEGDLPKMHEGGKEKLREHVENHQAELVVLDTFVKVKRPGDSQGYEAEYRAMEDLQWLRRQTDVSILVLHHTRKTNNQDEDIFDNLLGSTGLAAVPDNLLIFENRNKVLKLHGKGRMIEPFELPLVWVNPGFDVDEPDAELREKAPLQYQIKQRLREVKSASNSELASGLGKSVNSISNATKKLLDAGRDLDFSNKFVLYKRLDSDE